MKNKSFIDCFTSYRVKEHSLTKHTYIDNINEGKTKKTWKIVIKKKET